MHTIQDSIRSEVSNLSDALTEARRSAHDIDRGRASLHAANMVEVETARFALANALKLAASVVTTMRRDEDARSVAAALLVQANLVPLMGANEVERLHVADCVTTVDMYIVPVAA